MQHDGIVDGEALSECKRDHPSADEVEAAFKRFQAAVEAARRIGSVTYMRAAVKAYDEFAELVRWF